LDPAAAGRPPDRPGLPVALGHRLVLVLAGVRRAEPAGAAAVAQALPAQRRLLAPDPLREPAPLGRQVERASGTPRARAGGAGRRDPDRAYRGLPALVPARGPDRADLAVPARLA